MLAVNNNAMTFSDRSGGISRRRVIFNFTEVVPENERDTLLAEKIGTDKQAAEAAANSASTDASAAASANNSAQTAKQDSETAAGAATSKASEAVASAQEAAAAQAAAEQAAATVQPENLLQNANNLDDLTNKPAARQNLDVFSKEEIADMLSGYLGQVEWQGMRGALEPGTVPRDGQEVSQTGIFADLYAKGVAGKLPTCTEAEWQADPLKRGCYVLNSSTGKLRLPDDNGVQPGSLKIPVKVGDGGVSANDGMMGASALPNVKGSTQGYSILGGITADAASNPGGINTSPTNPINIKRGTPSNKFGTNDADAAWGSCIDLNLNRGSSVYKDGVTQIEPNRTQGCWTVRYATKATNGGSIDALALANAIAAGDADLLARIVATNSRIDYALLDFGTMVTSQRKVINNPFGNNQPVEVVAEVQRNNSSAVLGWTEAGWIYNSQTGASFGVKAGYLEGTGIVVQCGSAEMSNTSINTGMPMLATSNAATNLPVRVHVRKIKQ